MTILEFLTSRVLIKDMHKFLAKSFRISNSESYRVLKQGGYRLFRNGTSWKLEDEWLVGGDLVRKGHKFVRI